MFMNYAYIGIIIISSIILALVGVKKDSAKSCAWIA